MKSGRKFRTMPFLVEHNPKHSFLIRYSSRLQALMAAKVPREGKRVQVGSGTASLFQ